MDRVCRGELAHLLDERIGDAVLLTSEVVTNTVEHSNAGTIERGLAVAFNHPDRGDATTARVVTLWRRV